MALVNDSDSHKLDETAQHRENLALAELVKVFANMLLIAGFAGLLLGAFAFDRDARARHAMKAAVATVTGEHQYPGAYYIVYEADGKAREALLDHPREPLNVGDRVEILYDPNEYANVRMDTPASPPLIMLSGGALCAVLGGIGMFGQVYLKNKQDNPWHDDSQV